MTVPLPDGEQHVFAPLDLSVLYPVVTRDIPRVNSGVIGRLNSAGSRVTAFEDSVTVAARDQVTSPACHRPVPVPQMRFPSLQKLVC